MTAETLAYDSVEDVVGRPRIRRTKRDLFPRAAAVENQSINRRRATARISVLRRRLRVCINQLASPRPPKTAERSARHRGSRPRHSVSSSGISVGRSSISASAPFETAALVRESISVERSEYQYLPTIARLFSRLLQGNRASLP
jgi:hypothetical protein